MTSSPTLPPLPVEPEPHFTETLFGDRTEIARAYAGALAMRGVELGLIGPLELPRLWTRHIINCALVSPLLRAGTVGDIGSGAGLPGIVLAIARPDLQLVLIEPMERRVQWLQEITSTLGLTNVEISRARAEEVRLGAKLDQITARAVSALSKLIPISVPLVRPGGELIFMKGLSMEREVEAARHQIRKARLSNVELLTLGEEHGTEVTRVFRATVD